MSHRDSPVGLLGLPDELLLEVLSELTVLRDFGDENYATVSMGHQDENQQRIAALGSLCLTSKRLHSIATPVLYSAFVAYPKLSKHRLTSFLLAIIEKPHLGEHITFVGYTGIRLYNAYNPYNQNPECRGSLLERWNDNIIVAAGSLLGNSSVRFKEWASMLANDPEQAKVALLILLVPKIEQLAIVAVRCVIINLRILGLYLGCTVQLFEPRDQLPSLQYLQLGDRLIRIGTQPCIKLSILHLSSNSLRQQLQNLEKLPQNSLKRLTCGWKAVSRQRPYPVLPGPIAEQAGSLEFLRLQEEDIRTGRFGAELTLGSLTKFTALKTLETDCELLLGGLLVAEDSMLDLAWHV